MSFRVAISRLLAAALALAGMALSGPAMAAGEPLVVYTARKYQLVEQLFQEYGRERGIEVKSVTDDGAPLIQRLTAEGASSPADVFISVDAGDLWRATQAGLLQPVKSPMLEAAIPAHLRDPAGKLVRPRRACAHDRVLDRAREAVGTLDLRGARRPALEGKAVPQERQGRLQPVAGRDDDRRHGRGGDRKTRPLLDREPRRRAIFERHAAAEGDRRQASATSASSIPITSAASSTNRKASRSRSSGRTRMARARTSTSPAAA